MNIVVGSHYEKYKEELAFKLREGFADSHFRDDLRGKCYFCKGDIAGRGFLLTDSYSAKDQTIMVPIHMRCHDVARLGEFDQFS